MAPHLCFNRSLAKRLAGGADAVTVGFAYLVIVTKGAVDDVIRHALHCGGGVGVKPRLLGTIHQVVQGARLAIVIVSVAMVIAVRVAVDPQGWLLQAAFFGRVLPL